MRPFLSTLLLLCTLSPIWAASLLPPGHRPEPVSHHAFVGGKIVMSPGHVLEEGMVVIRDGRIVSVGKEQEAPAGARVWDCKGKTIYPGLIEIHLQDSEGGSGGNDASAALAGITESLTSGSIRFKGVTGDERDQGKPGAGYQLKTVHPETRVIDSFKGTHKSFGNLKKLGFTTANLVPGEGIFPGQAALVSLRVSNPNDAIVKPVTTQHIRFESSKGDREYPKSLMGIVAAIRQTLLDTQHLQKMETWLEAHPESKAQLEFNPSLTALKPTLSGEQEVVIHPNHMLMVNRIGKLAQEFQLKPIVFATGQEWQRPDLIAEGLTRFIVPVNFPSMPKFKDDEWESVSLEQLRDWDWAPENPSVITGTGASVAFTTHTLSKMGDFRKQLKKTMDRGMDEEALLAGLTTVPARFLKADEEIGTLAPGKRANLMIVDGDSWFDPDTKIAEVWIDGQREVITPAPLTKEEKDDDKKEEDHEEKPSPRVAKRDMDHRGVLFESDKPILFQGATIWTCTAEGVLEKTDVVIDKGMIVAIGKDLALDEAWAMREMHLVPAKNLHLTPGLIDAHSHSMILGGVNEGTLPSASMVRIADVVHSETRNIYDQLAGGLTTANLLHGSANPIGGQNAVIKLRDGAGPDGLIFEEAIQGIKFALGENVKQSNWGDDYTTRFPQTRMGVRTFFFNRFTAAREYMAQQEKFEAGEGPPVQVDLEMEALAEIIKGVRLIHCHSYRQDEILAFLRTMEEFDVTVGTLQHVLEGYKIADEIAKHGAGASAFSDWWAYKFEVYDAIPYAGTLMHDRGALVSFNSDSSDLARRMNLEAAKAVKYGGLSEEEALKFVTLNPARQLRIDDYVGSIEIGKHADIALWNGHPLSTTSTCVQTWIDGKKYFDRDLSKARFEDIKSEREALISKAKESSKKKKDEKEEGSGETTRTSPLQRLLQKYQNHSLDGSYSCCKQHSMQILQ